MELREVYKDQEEVLERLVLGWRVFEYLFCFLRSVVCVLLCPGGERALLLL